jgi:hypothetical protein
VGTFDFAIRRFHASELRDHGNTLREISKGDIDMVIVQGVFDEGTMGAIAERLEHDAGGFDVTPQMTREIRPEDLLNYGRGITPNGYELSTDLTNYLDAAARFRARCRELFRGHPDFESRMIEVFSSLSGARPVSIAQHANGRSYTPATVRYLPPGRHIPLHVGDMFVTLDVYTDLRERIETRNQLSYFLPIARPEVGGKLVVYSLEYGDPATPWSGDKRWADPAAVEARYEKIAVDPGVGDLLVFNGGRYYHYVDTVQGRGPRLTIGGFLAFTLDDRSVYFWA